MNVTGVALEGLKRAEAQLGEAARRTARLPAEVSEPPPTSDTVDLNEETVKILLAARSYEVNLKVIQTAEDIESHLLDVLA